MAKTIYEKIKGAKKDYGYSESSPLHVETTQNTVISDWSPLDEGNVVDSAGNILNNPEFRTIETPGQEVEKIVKPGEPGYDEWLDAVTADPSIEDKYKPSITKEYRGSDEDEFEEVTVTDPTVTETTVTPEQKRYNPGYFETLNKNMAEASARRGSARDTKRKIKDFTKNLSKNDKKALKDKKKELRKSGELKGRGSARDIQLMQEAGIAGSENFGVTNVEAATAGLDKTTKQFQSRVEGQTMDKSAGQLGNVQDKVKMKDAETTTTTTGGGSTTTRKRTKKGRKNVPGTLQYGENKGSSPFKLKRGSLKKAGY